VYCSGLPLDADYFSEGYWPLSFVVEVAEESNQTYSYTPRSDFYFRLDTCPRISIEICSDVTKHSDRYRLLLQAGLLVRVINTIKTTGDSFVAVAIYITENTSAEWYLVYQPDRRDQNVGIANS
jgi:hypothetical protein